MTSLDDLAAAEAENHHGRCCHEEDRASTDEYARPVCQCGCSWSAHRIGTDKKPCDTGSCTCREYRWCHDVTTTRTSTITRRTKETP